MKIRKIGAVLALVIVVLATVGSKVHLSRLSTADFDPLEIEQLPMELGEWKGSEGAGIDIRSQEILKLTRYVKRQYTKGDSTVTLYVGYWETQTGDYQAAKHSPALCLPSNGWSIQPKSAVEVPVAGSGEEGAAGGEDVRIKRILGEYRDSTQLFWYYFFTGQRDYAEEWKALINISLQKFFYGRSDGGIVEISTSLPTGMNRKAAEEAAAENLRDFLKQLYPALSELIDKSQPA